MTIFASMVMRERHGDPTRGAPSGGDVLMRYACAAGGRRRVSNSWAAAGAAGKVLRE